MSKDMAAPFSFYVHCAGIPRAHSPSDDRSFCLPSEHYFYNRVDLVKYRL